MFSELFTGTIKNEDKQILFDITHILRYLSEEPVNGKVLSRGEEVDVVGPSAKRGHLIVKNSNIVMDVPYHLLDLKVRGLNY